MEVVVWTAAQHVNGLLPVHVSYLLYARLSGVHQNKLSLSIEARRTAALQRWREYLYTEMLLHAHPPAIPGGGYINHCTF